MHYMGGKYRIAQMLAAHMAPYVSSAPAYVEPFVGSAWVMAAVRHPCRLAADCNRPLITLWKSLAAGWTPPTHLSKDEYVAIQARMDPFDPLTAFAGFGCSFSGKWFGGYANNDIEHNYAASASSSLIKKIGLLKRVAWRCQDYRELPIPKKAVIYCDPPYRNTTQYEGAPYFDTDSFWEFCRYQTSLNKVVFVSEYTAPDDFISVLKIATKISMHGKYKQRIEQLFVHKSMPQISIANYMLHGEHFYF